MTFQSRLENFLGGYPTIPRNGEDEDGAGSVGGGTTSAKEVETKGDVIGDGGGTEDVAEDAWRGGDAIGDVEDDDGTRGRAIGTFGTGGGFLYGPVSSLTRSVRIFPKIVMAIKTKGNVMIK
nr:hypothetical protein Iba_chr08eCG4680 [Ipomoea batatas]